MAEKSYLLPTLVILAALLGVILGAVAFSTHSVETKEVVKEVPTEVTKEIVVEKNVTVEKLVDTNQVTFDNAVKEYLSYLDDENLLSCKDNDYSLSDLTLGDLKEKAIKVDTSNRRDTVTTVSFWVKNKFTDSSDSHPCYRTDSVTVVFHSKPSLDTEVTVE